MTKVTEISVVIPVKNEAGNIDQLIKDGQIKKAEKRAIEILKTWK